MATEVDDGVHSPAISQQERWIHLTEWPLAIAGVVFVLCYAVEVLAQPGERRRTSSRRSSSSPGSALSSTISCGSVSRVNDFAGSFVTYPNC